MSLSKIETDFHLGSAAQYLILASSVIEESRSDSDSLRVSAMEAASILIASALDSIQKISNQSAASILQSEVFKAKPECQVYYLDAYRPRQ